jgi:hypothetical protein
MKMNVVWVYRVLASICAFSTRSSWVLPSQSDRLIFQETQQDTHRVGAGIAQWIQWLGYWLDDRGISLDSRHRLDLSLFSAASRPAPGLTQLSTQAFHANFTRGGRKLRALLYLKPTLRVCGAIPRLPFTPSSADVKERVEQYLFSPSRSSWPVLMWTLYLFASVLVHGAYTGKFAFRNLGGPQTRSWCCAQRRNIDL